MKFDYIASIIPMVALEPFLFLDALAENTELMATHYAPFATIGLKAVASHIITTCFWPLLDQLGSCTTAIVYLNIPWNAPEVFKDNVQWQNNAAAHPHMAEIELYSNMAVVYDQQWNRSSVHRDILSYCDLVTACCSC